MYDRVAINRGGHVLRSTPNQAQSSVHTREPLDPKYQAPSSIHSKGVKRQSQNFWNFLRIFPRGVSFIQLPLKVSPPRRTPNIYTSLER